MDKSIMLGYDKDKTMFWSVGDNIYYTKLSAQAESIRLGIEIKFHVYEDVFDVYDWENEPKESWDEILRQRAQQIRDKYDYLRLWYSGGVDSHTILLTFLNNHIHLDEIFMHRHDPTDKFNQLWDAEIDQAAIPFIQSIKNQIPKTKISILNFGSKEYEKYNERDFHYSNDLCFKPFSSREFMDLFPHLNKPHDIGSAAEIKGYDKPRLFMENGIYYTALFDSYYADNSCGDPYTVPFFITSDMPKIHSKQCHLLKKYLKENYANKINEDDDGDSIANIMRHNRDRKTDINMCCRYPLWKEISLGKGSSGLPTKQVMMLEHTRIHNYSIYDKYISFMNNEGSIHKERFNQGDIFMDFVGILSKKYSLGS